MSLQIDIALERGSFSAELTAQLPHKAAIFGPSGAGKTTLLDAIAGLVRPTRGRIVDSGQVLFDRDREIDVPPEQRRYGYAFQDDLLFPHMTVKQNLTYGRRAEDPAALSVDEIADELEIGSLLHRKPDRLSGGERRRVSLGRALLSSPRRLLLDEPLSGLHHSLRDEIVGLVRGIADRHDVSIVVVTHEMRLIELLEAPIFDLADGRLMPR